MDNYKEPITQFLSNIFIQLNEKQTNLDNENEPELIFQKNEDSDDEDPPFSTDELHMLIDRYKDENKVLDEVVYGLSLQIIDIDQENEDTNPGRYIEFHYK